MTSVPPAARPQTKGNPCTGAAPPPTVSSLVSPPIACSLVVCICLLARFLCFFILRSGQTIARASIETLPHQRVAAAYIHWLIAANGIASQRVDWDTAAAPAAGFGKGTNGHYPCPWPPATQRCRPWRHKVAKGWPIRSSTSEMVSAVTWDNPTCTLLYRRFPIDRVRRMRTTRYPR